MAQPVACAPPPNSQPLAMPTNAWPADSPLHPQQPFPSSSPWLPDVRTTALHQSLQHPLHQPGLHQELQTEDRDSDTDAVLRSFFKMGIADDSHPSTATSDAHALLHLPNSEGPAHSHLSRASAALAHQDLFFQPSDLDHFDPHDTSDRLDLHLNACPPLPSLPFVRHQSQDSALLDALSAQHRAVVAPNYDLSSTALQRNRLSQLQTASSHAFAPRNHPSSLSRSHTPNFPSQSGPRIKNDLYKTEICRSFAENGGFCKYGSKCQFAHGEAELRPVRRHPRYKTKLCRNFVNTGSCPYDTRCRFIHASDLQCLNNSAHFTGLSDQPRHDHQSDEYAAQLRNLLTMSTSHATLPNPAPTVPDPAAVPPRSMTAPPLSSNHSGIGVGHLDSQQQPGQTPSRMERSSVTEHLAKPVSTGLPADRVYHPTASVFRDYSDSSFNHSYSSMGALDADAPYVANSLPDRDIMGPAHPLKPRVSAATSEKESRAAKYSAPRETEKDDLLSQVSRELSSANDGSEMPNGSLATSTEVPADSGERTPASRSTPSSKRSRLPVFRNMATDNDDM